MHRETIWSFDDDHLRDDLRVEWLVGASSVVVELFDVHGADASVQSKQVGQGCKLIVIVKSIVIVINDELQTCTKNR